jgi:hypothetical protein
MNDKPRPELTPEKLDRLDAELLAELRRQVQAGETTQERADQIAATIRGKRG